MILPQIDAPVHDDDHTGKLEDSIALCLSGGGYRAMLFHCGTLWRLNELGLLRKLARVSSVSGGSITAGVLGLEWSRLDFDDADRAREFRARVVDRIHSLADVTIDVGAILGGMLPGISVSDRVEHAYRARLFGDATLQDLPADGDGPRFVINATSVQTGALYRFSRPYAGDYVVGRMERPRLALADAVAASSAFPPFLSPIEVDTRGATWIADDGMPAYAALRERAVLTDGGVYDNLGLETAYKRYRTLFVSDAGKKIEVERVPHSDWARHAVRALDVIDNQVRSLRVRILLDALRSGERKGAYFGIRTPVTDYSARPHWPVGAGRAQELADTPTRLAAMSRDLQERLVNLGYTLCDVALRSYYDGRLTAPTTLPYENAGI